VLREMAPACSKEGRRSGEANCMLPIVLDRVRPLQQRQKRKEMTPNDLEVARICSGAMYGRLPVADMKSTHLSVCKMVLWSPIPRVGAHMGRQAPRRAKP
jgi:hypothetical protein